MNSSEVEFVKFQSVGDDFILVDNRDGRYTKFLSNKDMKRRMCRRHFGIDACGIVELKQHPQYGLEFVFHTPKGHVGSMSGNGCICFVTYTKSSGIHPQLNDIMFLAGDGIHSGNYDPRTREGWTSMADIEQSKITQVSSTEFILNTGVPHMVVFTDHDVREIEDIFSYGDDLTEKWKQFETETSRVKVLYVYEKDGILHCRSCDKDLGREPISCGTATAAIGELPFPSMFAKQRVCQAIKSGCPVASDLEAKIQWPDGLMKCLLHKGADAFTKIRISGPVRQVFKGTFYTDSVE